jgi:hypothetical protein
MNTKQPSDKAEPMDEPPKHHGEKINPNEPKDDKPKPVTPEQQGGIAGP